MGFNPRIKNLDNSVIQLSGSAVTGTNSQFTTVSASVVSASSISVINLPSGTQDRQSYSALSNITSSEYTLTTGEQVLTVTGSSTFNIPAILAPNINSQRKYTIINPNASNVTVQYRRSDYDNSTFTISQQGAGGNVFISASDKTISGHFGSSVAINSQGNRIVVGEPDGDIENVTYDNAGKVYVYVSQSAGWIQQGAGGNSFISASNKAASDAFGSSVAINTAGNRIVVGAPLASSGGGASGGKVYLYVSGNTGWIQQGSGSTPHFTSSDGGGSDLFGTSVHINGEGNRIVVGAPSAVAGGIISGKVYIFISGTTGWIQRGGGNSVFISASDKAAGDKFGYSVAMNTAGDCIVVGAPIASPGGATNFNDAGKAYIYTSGSSGWILQTVSGNPFISASDKEPDMNFGWSVAINSAGDRIAIGASNANSGNSPKLGKVYIFVSGNTGWLQQSIGNNAYISPSDNTIIDNFGRTVSMNAIGDRIVVGSINKIYTFASTSVGWFQQASSSAVFITASDTVSGDNFGCSVAINASGTYIAAGASMAAPGSTSEAGKAYIFNVNTGSSNLPYFTGAYDTWPNGFVCNFNNTANTITTSSTKQNITLISDGTSSWWTL